MSDIRKRMERWFEGFGHTVYHHRYVAILLVLALIGGLATALPRIEMDTSTESFLHHEDPTLLRYNEFRHQFGRDELLVIAIKSPDVFTLPFLEKLRTLHDELERNVPHLDDITSLVNARNTRGEGDRLIVGDFLEDWPQTQDDLETLRRRALANPLYLNRVISQDGKFTTIVIKTDTYSSGGETTASEALEGFDDDGGLDPSITEGFEDAAPGGEKTSPPFLTDAENSETVRKALEIVDKYRADDFRIFVAGSPAITDTIKRSMIHDAMTFVRLVLIAISLCLLIMFRRITGVVLPLVIVGLSLIATLSLMALLDVPITLPTNALPSFILAVGVGASVHVLAIFYQNLQHAQDREAAICHALGHSGLAILLTSLTTAAGLLSFATAEVAPVAHLGIFAGFGVMFALVLTVVLLPAFLAVIPVKPKKERVREGGNRADRLLRGIADFSFHHARPIVLVSVVVILISVAGMTRLGFSHNPLGWLPPEMPIREATETVDHELRGAIAMEMVVDTGRENGLYDVDVLNRMDHLADELKTVRDKHMFVGATVSLADMLKEINQALNENRPEFYKIPQNPALVPQEFLLFENSGSDDLEDVVDSRFSKARFAIKVPWGDAIEYKDFMDDIVNRFKTAFGDRAEATATGMMPILVRTLYAAIHSAARSYLIAFVVITLMMILLLGRLRLGLLSMVPNLMPVVLTLGVIGWLDFPLDLFTMLVGSIAIGLAVDDTVHFMHNYRRYIQETGDVHESIRMTLTTTGRAMLVTSVVLSIGFFIYMGASMRNLFYFGLLTGITIITALLADYFLAPALLALTARSARKK